MTKVTSVALYFNKNIKIENIKTYKFKDGQELLDTLQQGIDLYNPKKGIYLFLYNDKGSIAKYDSIDIDSATQLIQKSSESGEYWGAYLGTGGNIYDEKPNKGLMSALNMCEYVYGGNWYNIYDLRIPDGNS